MKPIRRRLLTTLAILLGVGACSDRPDTAPTGPSSGADAPEATAVDEAPMAWRGGRHPRELVAAVETWNDNIATFGRLARFSPPVESRASAMANSTMHDIMNAVQRRFEPYAFDGRVRRPVSVEAAIATGAYKVLAALGQGVPLPEAMEFLEQAYRDYIAELDQSDEVSRGVALGNEAAAAMLALRDGDGSAGPLFVVFTSTGEPGKFRSPVGSGTGLTGPQALPHWGNVKPFALTRADQFRAPGMYGAASVGEAIKTRRYLADYAEVKRLGGTVSERTQDQTDIGFFWIESTVQGWNRVARVLAGRRHLDAWRLARLVAHVSLAEADAYISVFETKYHYAFWRPITAIRLGNLAAGTTADPNWLPSSLLVPALGGTPPIPEYSSAHAMAGAAAAAAILANLDGSTAFTMESPTLPGKSRSFRSVNQAVKENADSRIYIGFHFRQATLEGNDQGWKVGRFVTSNTLRRVRGHERD